MSRKPTLRAPFRAMKARRWPWRTVHRTNFSVCNLTSSARWFACRGWNYCILCWMNRKKLALQSDRRWARTSVSVTLKSRLLLFHLNFPLLLSHESRHVWSQNKAKSVFFLAIGRAPGEIKRSRDLRGGRWSWTLTFAQKRSWVGRWSWAEQVGRLLLRVVQVVHQQRCNGHCLSDSVQHSSWKSNCAVHKSLGNGEGTPP